VLALATFCSWLLFAIPVWAALAAWQRAGLRTGWRDALRIAAIAAAAVVALNGALALAYGYDPFSALHALGSAYGHGVARSRPYGYWLVGSPAAWAVMLGLPIAWCSLRALASRRDPAAIALWAIIVVAALLGVTKAETERIWLPFAPLACAAAAAAVPPSRLRPILGLLLFQGLAVELLFFTIW
jgi:methylthioxylose transferase